ncbi:MAG: HAD family hydrolase [Acidobacteriales bacterium]|nr:HAD family hydrolase [Terriglobales bacterium]
MASDTVFLFDVDNTLLDNDAVSADLKKFLDQEVGVEREQRYWKIFEELRTELGYADYLGALQRYRIEYPTDPHLLELSQFMIDYPFKERVFPGALEVLASVSKLGRAVVLSDGDVVFQPLKIRRSGIYDTVAGQVLIYIHKEQELADVERRFPASHYVLVDDKVRILAAIKQVWGDRVSTVFPLQGHYALDAKQVAAYPAADATVEKIGDLLSYDWRGLLER